MRNFQSCTIEAPAGQVAPLLATAGSSDDLVWPRRWPPQVFDRPPGVGARGGHAVIRYSITEYEPGSRVRYAFDPGSGIEGWHEFRLEPAGSGRCVVTHEINGRTTGGMLLGWPLAIRWFHEALVADLFDNLHRLTGHPPARPARWSLWVRFLRATLRRTKK
ncbi:SRPBCC family protein [Longispora albida]|uniref:SRPBCC family protein n=1 Tax=Longispora albida TaxID=203523 RepID=UPI000365BA55|nr:SRPBCC family protein [Longispora albida]